MEPEIEIVPSEPIVDAGLADGAVIATPQGQPDEVIVYEYDEVGTFVGWHKEPING